MTNLTPVSSFDPVPQLETNTLALGGPGGPMNLPAQALTNRTQWLHDNAVAGQAGPFAEGAGTANACAANFVPPITALADGLKLRFTALASNTGPATFAPNALAPAPIVGGGYAALQGGEILANGTVEIVWNSALSAWVLVAQAGASPQVPDGTQSQHAASKGQVDAVRSDLASSAVGKGSKLVRFLSAGIGAVARWVEDWLREQPFSVKDFGAVGDGVADDTAAISAAIAACVAVGGGEVRFPRGLYKLTSTITINSSNVLLRGAGFNTYHDVGTTSQPTMIRWAGGASQMFVFTSTAGASNQCISGCGLVDIALDCANLATVGVELISHRAGRFRFMVYSATQWVLRTGVVAVLGEAEDTQYNVFEVWGRQLASGGGGICMTGNGTLPTPNANTSFNKFMLVDLQINTGIGIQFGNTDTNFFELARIIGVTSGKPYEFLGSNLNAGDTARGNFVKFLSSNVAGKAYGTTSYTYPSASNYIGLDTGNGSPYPVVETGAICYYSASDRYHYKPAHARMTLADALPAAMTEQANVNTESARIYNSSSDHVRLTDGTNEWGINISGGNLRILRVSGTGFVDVSNLLLKTNNVRLIAAAGTAGVGEVQLGSTTATTVGAAGGASALPATPVGYLIINVAGTARKIPYYTN